MILMSTQTFQTMFLIFNGTKTDISRRRRIGEKEI